MTFSVSSVRHPRNSSTIDSTSLSASPSKPLSNDDFIKLVSYESIASVLRQCDKSFTDKISALSGNYTRNNFKTRSMQSNRSPKNKLFASELANLKSKSKCETCQKFGYWSSDHNADGSFKLGEISTDTPPNRKALYVNHEIMKVPVDLPKQTLIGQNSTLPTFRIIRRYFKLKMQQRIQSCMIHPVTTC